MEYANWLGFLRSRKLTSFSSFLPAVHFAWLCYCPASVSGAPYPHISLFADFRSECSVPSTSTHPSLSLGPAVPPGTLSCSFFSPLVSGRKCQYLLAALWAAPRCQPLWCSPPSSRKLFPAAFSTSGSCQSFLYTSQVSNLQKITWWLQMDLYPSWALSFLNHHQAHTCGKIRM